MLARATVARSTVTIDDQSSCTFAPRDDMRWPYRRPTLFQHRKAVRVQRSRDEDGDRIDAAHDGYLPKFGLSPWSIDYAPAKWQLDDWGRFLHHRQEGGRSLSGHVFAIRFHLHPTIEVQQRQDGHSARLYLPSRKSWIFACEGGDRASKTV